MSTGSAVPKQVVSMPKVKGLKAIKPKIHSIYPINSSGTTSFRRATDGSDQNTQVVFSIPSYKNSWLNPQRTFLRFNLETDDGCWATHQAVQKHQTPLPWPANFDQFGTYLYGYASPNDGDYTVHHTLRGGEGQWGIEKHRR